MIMPHLFLSSIQKMASSTFQLTYFKEPDTCMPLSETLTQTDQEDRPTDYGVTLRVQAMSSIVTFLSILGTFLILLSFVLFKDAVTKSRVLRLHMSLADFGIGISILVASAFYFDLQLEKEESVVFADKSQSCVVFEGAAGQALFAAYSVLAAICWTLTLAAYSCLLVMDRSSTGCLRKVAKLVFAVCWAFPLLVPLWLTRAHRLVSRGDESNPRKAKANADMFTVLFPMHLYAILTVVVILFTCTATKFYLLIKVSYFTFNIGKYLFI